MKTRARIRMRVDGGGLPSRDVPIERRVMTNGPSGAWDAGDAEIHYERSGGAHPPLVLLHGLTASGACWRPVARPLEAAFDVVMPDARGHGTSSAPASGYRYEDHAQDVVALIQGLKLAAPILVGHSMGGMTAAVVARQLGAELRGVVLVDPTFLSPDRQREVFASDVAERHRQLLRETKVEIMADLRARHPHRSAEMIELLAEARRRTRLSAFDVLRPPNPDYREVVSAIRIPILLVLGDAPVVSLETARELQALNPRVRIEQIVPAGHGLPYDQPERLAGAVEAFARRSKP